MFAQDMRISLKYGTIYRVLIKEICSHLILREKLIYSSPKITTIKVCLFVSFETTFDMEVTSCKTLRAQPWTSFMIS